MKHPQVPTYSSELLPEYTKEELIQIIKAYETTQCIPMGGQNASLKESQKWSFFVQQSSLVYLELDIKGTVLFWNRAAEKTFGFTEEEALGHSIDTLIFDTSRGSFPRFWQTTQQKANQVWERVYHTTKQQETLVCNWYNTLLVGENPTDDRWICVLQNITQRIEAEDALKSSEEKFRKVIQHSIDGVTFTDAQGRVIEWNQGLAQITEVPTHEAMGQFIWDIHFKLMPPKRQTPQAYNTLKNQRLIGLRTGKYAALETLSEDEIVTASGKTKIIGTVVFLVESSQGYMHCSITRDITEQKHTEHQLRLKNARLNELNREKDSIMDIVAHDLKAPLNKIEGLCQLLKMDGELNDNQNEYLSLIFKELNIGKNLIRDLLDISMFEHKKSPLQLNDILLYPFVKGIADAYQNALHTKNIELHIVELIEGVHCTSDRDYLARVFDNLLSNAVKFSPSDTKITIKLGASDHESWFAIADQGPGLSEEDKQKMFRKFQRLSAQPTGGESSTGLGLAIIKILVERLGGRLEVESLIGEGSTFTVTIPKKPKKQQNAATSVSTLS